MTECMQTCQKYKSRAPGLQDENHLNYLLQHIADHIFMPGTTSFYHAEVGQAFWMGITDVEEEGKWVDWYTGQV